MKQLDNLFREKLEHHYMEAPANAWKRIEAHKVTPKRNTAWLKIAASLLLVAAAGITTLVKLEETPESKSHLQSDKATHLKNGSEVKTPLPLTESRSIASGENKTSTLPPIGTEEKLNKNTVTRNEQTVTLSPAINVDLVVAHSENKFNNLPTENIIEPPTTDPVISLPVLTSDQPLNTSEESVTIVYAAQEVDAKFLFSVGEMDATSETKKTSSFRKLFRKVFALKNDSHGLGDLRQRKNEILALNFRNEKRERNN